MLTTSTCRIRCLEQRCILPRDIPCVTTCAISVGSATSHAAAFGARSHRRRGALRIDCGSHRKCASRSVGRSRNRAGRRAARTGRSRGYPGRNRKVAKNRYFMGFRRCFDSGLLTELLTLPMFGRGVECGAMSKTNALVTAARSLSNYPCDKLIGGSIVPTALTIKMTKTPKACSPKM